MEKLTFAAYLPEKQSAIAIHGRDGARVTLDIPESDIAAAARLLLLRDKPLKVTIEELGGG